jgi:hypothetical protein
MIGTNPRQSGNKTYRFAVFPGLWLLSVVGLCVANIDVNITVVVTFVIGTITYAVASRNREGGTARRQQMEELDCAESGTPLPYSNRARARLRSGRAPTHGIVIFAVFALSLLSARVYYWVTWDPVGNPYDNGWGRSPLPDISETYRSVANSNGILVTTRRVRASLLIAESPIEYFLFVHKLSQPMDHRTLVFRYFATDGGWDGPPRSIWISNNSLLVRTGPGDVLQVTKQVHFIDGITIQYVVPSTARAAALRFWERPLF